MNNEFNSVSQSQPSTPSPFSETTEKEPLSTQGSQPSGGDLYYEGTDALSQTQSPTAQVFSSQASGSNLNILANSPLLVAPKKEKEIEEESIATTGVDQAAKILKEKAELQKKISQYMKEYYEAAKEINESLPKGAESVNYSDFLEAVLKSMQGMKDQMIQNQITNAKVAQDTALRTKTASEERLVLADAQFEEMLKMENMQGWMKLINDIVKWAAPALAVLSIIFTALTFGAAAPLIVASAALLAYSVADSVFNITATVMEVVNDALSAMMPNSPIAQAVVKVVMVAAVIAVAIAAIAVGNAALGAKIGSQFFQQAVKFALEMAKPLMMQLVVISLTASNAIPELAGGIVSKFGVDESTSEAVQAAVMILQLIVITVSMILLARSGGSSSATTQTESVSQRMQQTLAAIGNKIKEFPTDIKETATKTFEALKTFLSSSYWKQAATELASAPQGFRSLGVWGKLATSSQTASLSIEATSAATMSVLNGMMANYTKAIGDVKAQDQFLLEMQRSLDQMTSFLNAGIDSSGKNAIAIQRDITSFLESFTQSVIQASTFRG